MNGKDAKIAGSLLLAIISGLIIYFLTRDGGLLNPQSAKVSVSAYTLSATPGQRLSVQATVSNVGKKPLEGCRLFWNPTGTDVDNDPMALADSARAGKLAYSPQFAIQPGDQQRVCASRQIASTRGSKSSRPVR
jgi:hypothetical protein